MTVYCGTCGGVVYFSHNKDWTTNKKYPELTCNKCHPHMVNHIAGGFN